MKFINYKRVASLLSEGSNFARKHQKEPVIIGSPEVVTAEQEKAKAFAARLLWKRPRMDGAGDPPVRFVCQNTLALALKK